MLSRAKKQSLEQENVRLKRRLRLVGSKQRYTSLVTFGTLALLSSGSP